MCGSQPSDFLIRRMKETVQYSCDHVASGGIPFTAYVIDAKGLIVGRGVNRVREHNDPTAHAEIEAIRDACRFLGTPYLSGFTLLASGEPCAMCYLNARFSGLSRIYFAADRDEAALYGFDYRQTYSQLSDDPINWRVPDVGKLAVPGSLDPFIGFSPGF